MILVCMITHGYAGDPIYPSELTASVLGGMARSFFAKKFFRKACGI